MPPPTILEQPPPSADNITKDSSTRSRRWSVIARSRFHAQQIVEATAGISLAAGSPFRDVRGQLDPTCPLQSLSIEGKPEAPVGGTGQYIVDASYSSKSEDKEPTPGGPMIWRPRPSVVTSPVDLDGTGKPITMSSEEPVDPPLTAVQPDTIFHGDGYIRAKNEMAAYDRFEPFVATVNAQPFLGKPKGSLLCYAPQLDDQGNGWIKISIDIHYRKPKKIGNTTYEGWMDVFPDKGTRELIDSSVPDPEERYADITIVDDNKFPRRVDSPVLLDGSGRVLNQTNGVKPYYNSVMNYTYTDFNSFPK